MVINKFDGFSFDNRILIKPNYTNERRTCLKNKEGLLCNLIYKQRKRQFEADL